METQVEFLWRATDPWTSREAAKTVNVGASQRIVLDAFHELGAMDDRQLVIAVRHAMSDSRARGARCELARAGLLKCVGTIGNPARRVWELNQ